MYYLRLRRLGHLEAEDLAGHTSTRPNPLDQLLADAGGAPHPDERRERAAGQALERSLRTASMIDARTAQALDRALLLYGKLQERILADEPEAVDGPEAIDVEST